MQTAHENKIGSVNSLSSLRFAIVFAVILGASEALANSSREVSLYVTVEDGDKIIGGLTEENFRLTEQDRPRPFRLEPPETPSTIALLVEYSRSSWFYANDIISAMQGFLSVAPDGNWYALATLSHNLQIDVDFTKQKGKLASGFASLGQPAWNEVDTFDAVYHMLEKMERLPRTTGVDCHRFRF